MKNRLVIAGIAALAVAGLVIAGCSSDSKDSSSTTTTAKASSTSSSVVGNVLPPIIITPQMADGATGMQPVPAIKVGDTVVFSVGAVAKGSTITAVSSSPSVFEVTSKGTNDGTVALNAGGKAIAPGTAKVSLTTSGSGAETSNGTFTLVITK